MVVQSLGENYGAWGILLLAAMPVIELKGAIPLAIGLGYDVLTAFMLSYVGSILPCIPILRLYTIIISYMHGHQPWDRIARWIDSRVEKNRTRIDRYGLWGLFIFVLIPAPGTGVWTGSAIAAVLRMPFIPAMLAIILGNLAAGLIVLLFSVHVLA